MNTKNLKKECGKSNIIACQTPKLLLDSNLISTTKTLYNIKLIDCNDIIQIYLYDNKNIKRVKGQWLQLPNSSNSFSNENDTTNDSKSQNETITLENNLKLINTIDKKNIIRSKLKCQRIAKANINEWQTFITLTFAENVVDVKIANKRFNYFVNKIRRVYKDFKYLCVTEFQKRGAIHYHLLTNIDINNSSLIYSQKDNSKFKHIKYWQEGFTSIEQVKGDHKKIIGYIAKYMTKDIDNRLFNHRRFFYSLNLNIPKENFINSDNKKEKDFYIKKIQDKKLIYKNEYVNPYDNTPVIFLEFSK